MGTSEQVQAGGGGLDLTGYDPAEYNILSPVLRADSAAPYLRLRAVEVRLDPDVNKGEVYAAPGTRWEKNRQTGEFLPVMVSPAKPGLLKLASANGLVLDPHNSRRIKPDACDRCLEAAQATGQGVRCGDCPCRYDVAYQAIGAVRSDTGWRILKATYEWSLDAQRRKITREGRKRQGKAQEKGESFDLEAYVEDRLDQVIAERYGLAESKALMRLIRAICYVRQSYTRQEAARPFLVTRTELAPDFSDPAVRAAIAERALSSGIEIFGPGASEQLRRLPAPAVAQVIEHLAGEPDFKEAPERAAEAPAEEAAEDPEVENGPEPDSDAGDQAPPSEGQEEMPSVACEDCGKVLSDSVVAFCQSARGKQSFGGQNLCYGCQEKRRKAGAR